MEKKMMKSNGVDSRSSAMKRRRLFSAAAVLLICCLVFVGAAGAAEYVAEIEGKGPFTSIQAAVEAAGNGDKILVTESHNLLEHSEAQTVSSNDVLILVDKGKDITIDLNGKTVTADYSGDNWNTYQEVTAVIWVDSGAKLTLTDSSEGNGALKVIATVANQNKNDWRVNYMLVNYNNGDDAWDEGYSLIIEGGNYIFDFGVHDESSCIVYSQKGGTTLVVGGTFEMTNTGSHEKAYTKCPWIFNVKSNNQGSIIVTGGTFNADVNHQFRKYEVEVPEEKNLAVSKIGGEDSIWWKVVPAAAYVIEYDDDSGLYPRNVGYATVKEAVKAANEYPDTHPQDTEHETITLLKDVELEDMLEFTKPTVFNMDGHKLIWKGGVYDNILTVSDNNKLTIDSFDIIREGYTITKWKLDGEEHATLPVNTNGQVVVQTSLSIAEPEPNTYTVIFDKNGAESGTMADQEFIYDVAQPLTLNAFTKIGYSFTGWKTNPNDSKSVYTDGQLVKNLTTINEGTVTVYANWTANKHTVTFDADEGTVSESTKEVTFDQLYGTLPTPTLEGYEFVGWYLDDTLITENIKVTVDEDHTLTALWKEIPDEENSAEGDVAPPSSGGSGSGGALSFPRTTTNGGLVDFGSSKIVKALMLPEGSSGSVLLKVDTVEKWPKALETEYTFDISVEKLGDGMAYIHFEIPVSTLESLELTPADIGTYHLVDDVWVKLATTYEVKDGTVCYEAATDSFSPFKLVIEEGAAVPKEEETVPIIPPTETPDVPDEPEILPPIDEPTKPADEPETPAPILAVLAGLGAAVIVRRK